MKKKTWLIVLIIAIISLILFISLSRNQHDNTIYIDVQPTTEDIGVSGDNLVLPTNQSFYLQIEDGHVTDVIVN